MVDTLTRNLGNMNHAFLTRCKFDKRAELLNEEVGKYAPKIISVQIDPEKIGDVVGQRGKTINEIIARVFSEADNGNLIAECQNVFHMVDTLTRNLLNCLPVLCSVPYEVPPVFIIKIVIITVSVYIIPDFAGKSITLYEKIVLY